MQSLAEGHWTTPQGRYDPGSEVGIGEDVKDYDGVVYGTVGRTLRGNEHIWVRKLALK